MIAAKFSSPSSLRITGKPVSRQWGVSLGGRYDITDQWAVGGRGEYMGANQGSESGTQFSVTGTVRYLPVEQLVLSLEPRAEFAARDIYFARPFTTDPTTGETILLHPERQKGLQGKIAAARAKRLDAGLDREVFMDDATPEPPEAFETTHPAFREELRRIIAGYPYVCQSFQKHPDRHSTVSRFCSLIPTVSLRLN